MKRVVSACICQTLRFFARDDSGPETASGTVRQEVEHYKRTLDKNRTLYRLVEESEQPDGSIVLKVIKQYNHCPVGDYLN